jgi:PPOX class probable F420-dependent enzyme
MLTEPVRKVLGSDALAHLTTLDAAGRPYVTLAWVGIENDEIVMGTLFDQKKLKNMRREPRVALSIETGVVEAIGLAQYLVLYGTARVTEGGAPELLQELAYTYMGSDVKFPPMPEPPPGFVTRIKVDRVAGVGPWAAD